MKRVTGVKHALHQEIFVAFKIAFFGLPLAALLLERDGHEIVLAAICRDDALGVRRGKRCFGDRFLMKPDATDASLADRVRILAPDLVVSWFWTKRLPMRIVKAAKLGGIGAHPSLLPRHRGPDPTYWAIASGDAETGVSVHYLEEEYDTGDVLATARIAIDPDYNAWQLARALDRPSLKLLRSTVAAFARGEPPSPVKQNEAEATVAPSPTDDDCAITWDEPTEKILRHIRALAPAPGAWTDISGALVTLLEARAVPSFPAILWPGEALWDGGRCIVRTRDGAVEIVHAEIDGQPAKPTDLARLLGSCPTETER